MTSIRTEIRRISTRGVPPFRCEVTVESVAVLSPGFRRVVVRGDGLAAYREVRPADAFKIVLPPDGVLRAFTVRRFDPARSRIEFDVAMHDHGVVTAWLDTVAPGDVLGFAGMRHEFHAGAVDRHVIVGDPSALPAVAAIVESLASGTRASVHLAVEHDADRALVPVRAGIDVNWVADGSLLEHAVREHERPGGRVQAWLAAEASVVRGLRRVVADLGVRHEDLHAAAYWKAGLTSTDREAPEMARYDREIAEGADAFDPDVRERVELEV